MLAIAPAKHVVCVLQQTSAAASAEVMLAVLLLLPPLQLLLQPPAGAWPLVLAALFNLLLLVLYMPFGMF
jgi:hypothetical protein